MPTLTERLGADIAAKADALATMIKSNPEMTDDQLKDVEAKAAELETLRGQLAAEESKGAKLQAALKAAQDAAHDMRQVNPTIPFPSDKTLQAKQTITLETGESEYEKFVQTGGFKGLAHFASEVKRAGERPGTVTTGPLAEFREKALGSEVGVKALFGMGAKAASGLNEFVDNEGGVLVPTQFASGVWQRSLTDDFNILSIVPTIPVTGRDLEVPALNDKSRADGSRYGGVTGYWTGEAAQYTSSKPTFRNVKLSLNKLTVLTYATEELLEDSTAAEAILTRAASSEMRFKINDAAFRGTGVGMPLGFLNAACKVTVSRGTASHVTAVDLDGMYARRSQASGQGMVWLANQDIEPDLANLNYTVSSASAVWLYQPAGLTGAPTIKGKPTYYTEQSETLGTSGDLILLDPSAIGCIVKATGIQSAVSMHLRFDYQEVAYRWSVRIDMRPYWETSLTRFKGANALSPIVVLN